MSEPRTLQRPPTDEGHPGLEHTNLNNLAFHENTNVNIGELGPNVKKFIARRSVHSNESMRANGGSRCQSPKTLTPDPSTIKQFDRLDINQEPTTSPPPPESLTASTTPRSKKRPGSDIQQAARRPGPGKSSKSTKPLNKQRQRQNDQLNRVVRTGQEYGSPGPVVPEGSGPRPVDVPDPHIKSPTPTVSTGTVGTRPTIDPFSHTPSRWPGMVAQPESRPISQEQLAAEIKGIYAGLVMVEAKCLNIDTPLSKEEKDPVTGQLELRSDPYWQALFVLHRTLLHEHHDFFLASQHPSASPALRRLAAKYSMPARMWKHGIHSFLEILRARLPLTLDYMIAFIYVAYQMMALLYETVPTFEDTWIECLGDISRYRMAIEEVDLKDREVWTSVSRYWYTKASDRNPNVGRLYHHLAILARPNALQQLYFYCRSLTSVQPFISTRTSMETLMDPIMGRAQPAYLRAMPVDTTLIRAHSILFDRKDLTDFDATLRDFLRHLELHIGRVTAKWKEQGAYIAIANVCSIFEFCEENSFVAKAYFSKAARMHREKEQLMRSANGLPQEPQPGFQQVQPDVEMTEAPSDLSRKMIAYGCRITFSTLVLVLREVGNKNVYPYLHCTLAFLFSITDIPSLHPYVLANVPWDLLVSYLNNIAKSEKMDERMESPAFIPQEKGESVILPEDYRMRGQVFTSWYHPDDFFSEDTTDEEERYLEVELASVGKVRCERILWLAARIASHEKWIHYDAVSKKFSTIPSALQEQHEGAEEDLESRLQELLGLDFSDINEVEMLVPDVSANPEDPGNAPMEHRQGGPRDPFRGQIVEGRISMAGRMLLPNYTALVLDAGTLLKHRDLVADLLRDGSYRVVLPEAVLVYLYDTLREKAHSHSEVNAALAFVQQALTDQIGLEVRSNDGTDFTDVYRTNFDSSLATSTSLSPSALIDTEPPHGFYPTTFSRLEQALVKLSSVPANPPETSLRKVPGGENGEFDGAKAAVVVTGDGVTAVNMATYQIEAVSPSQLRKVLTTTPPRTVVYPKGWVPAQSDA